jgi:hypothetical protein
MYEHLDARSIRGLRIRAAAGGTILVVALEHTHRPEWFTIPEFADDFYDHHYDLEPRVDVTRVFRQFRHQF